MPAAFSFTQVPFSATPAFQASGAFQIRLTGNVTSSTLTGIGTGQLVTFLIIQDSLGGRTFTWPTNVKNASSPNPLANSLSIQSFIFDGTNAYPINPMTYD